MLLIIDVMVLLAITGRITDWGFSRNKTAALGENAMDLTPPAPRDEAVMGARRSPDCQRGSGQECFEILT